MSATDKVLQPEVLPENTPATQKNLITILVLSVTLAHQVLGQRTPNKGKLEKGEGRKIITAIENAMKANFPEIAPMVLGMFGIEMMSLMPLINNPDKLIADMVKEYSSIIPNVISNTQPNMG